MSESITKNAASSNENPAPNTPRRGFIGGVLGWSSSAIMAAGLAAGYGTLAAFAGRFLFPVNKQSENWQFVAVVDQMSVGQALPYQLPSGAKVVIARQAEGDSADAFVALSSICPHLGCAVHWEAQNDRFFCPCHNGAFDPTGKATEGPTAAASQSLKKFSLKVERGLLYIAVSNDALMLSSNKVKASPYDSRNERA
ncbi:MAG: Rieske (2Fe-2S) protein [Planctomycetales bacterium]|nr:Rieske (2Fe-2S) protein [Planctomycetales bacterium]